MNGRHPSTKHRFFATITRFGGTGLGRRAAALVDSLNRAFQNDNSDHETNGEAWLVRSLAPLAPRIVLDIGANVGTWGRMALDVLPTATVHSFEPIESTFTELTSSLREPARQHAHHLALTASEESSLPMWMAGHSTLASAVPDNASTPPTHTVPASTGDRFCLDNGIDHIDLLKVDTEGHDLDVLRGFSVMLECGAIDVVQFEFTLLAIFARVQLRDFYDLLQPLGYRIGKLYPTWIDWRDWDAHEERYYRCNFVAIRDGSPAAYL